MIDCQPLLQNVPNFRSPLCALFLLVFLPNFLPCQCHALKKKMFFGSISGSLTLETAWHKDIMRKLQKGSEIVFNVVSGGFSQQIGKIVRGIPCQGKTLRGLAWVEGVGGADKLST